MNGRHCPVKIPNFRQGPRKSGAELRSSSTNATLGELEIGGSPVPDWVGFRGYYGLMIWCGSNMTEAKVGHESGVCTEVGPIRPGDFGLH